MDTIEAADQQLQSSFARFDKCCYGFSMKSVDDQEDVIKDLEQILQEINMDFQSFCFEFRGVDEQYFRTTDKDYVKIQQEHAMHIRKCEEKFSELKYSFQEKDASQFNYGEKGKGTNNMTTSQLYAANTVLHKDMENMLQNDVVKLNDVITIHDTVIDQLQSNQEEMLRIKDELNDMQGDMELAKVELRKLLKKIASQKLIIIIILLIVLAVIALAAVDIYYSIKKKNQKK